MATFQKVKLGYQKKTLGEVIDFIDGDRGTNYPSQGEFFTSGDCLFLSTKNVPNRKFAFEEKMFIDAEKDAVLRKGKLQRGDYVLTTRGTVGNFAYYDERVPYENIRINSGMVILRKKSDELDENFFRYYLSSASFSEQVKSRVSGSAQPQLPIRDMVSMEIILPDLTKQTRIASVLSAYDDLIENNEKRIKALEEMAQLLYTEWFVKFKFPGYEKIKMIDSGTEYGMVPEGWEVVGMRSITKVVDCLHTKKPEEIKVGNNILLQLNNILDNGIVDLTEKYLISDVDYKRWTANIELRGGDCLVTNVGRIAASAQIANGMAVAAGRNMTVLRPENIPASFLIQYLHSRHMEKEVSRKTDAGAIMGSLNVKNIYLLKVLLPGTAVLELFSKLASGFREEMNKLYRQNYVLSQTRDLLIPQLVTGRRELK